MKKIVVVDFGAGNLYSIFNALNRISEVEVIVTSVISEVRQADFIVMPGVGVFDKAIAKLRSVDGMVECLYEQVIERKKPFLGICIGMQLLADTGYENVKTKGLSFIKGQVRKIPNEDRSLLVPHMGWNSINVKSDELQRFDQQDFYFVHSYYFDAEDEADVVAYCDYGVKIPCALKKENILATQFHPEKSGKQGLEFLKYFVG